jgi:hypothetical protein
MREHLRAGNHVTLIAGFRSADLLFWTGEDERVGRCRREFGDQLDVIYTTNDGTFGVKGFVTTPLEEMLSATSAARARDRRGRHHRPAADDARRQRPDPPYGVPVTVASLNSIMVDATGMCGACMVPVTIDGKMVRKHACIDGPEIDAHIIDWDKFLPRFGQFRTQEQVRFPRFFVCQRVGFMLPVFPDAATDPLFQELHWRLVAEGRMLPFSVVKDLDVFKGGRLDFGMSRVANTMHPLVLEAVEPALRRRVIPAVPLPAHRAGHAVGLELVLKDMAGVLAAPVGVVHQPIAGRFLNQAMVSASVTMSAVMRGFSDQPTTSRLNRSSTIAR